LFTVAEAGSKGRGLFAQATFSPGSKLLDLGGIIRRTVDLQDDEMALQIGPDQWLCSKGENLDDFANHSCEPNAGFLQANELALYALKTISPGEEITWDYSTSINESDWDLDCQCGSTRCRKTVLPWHQLKPSEREELRHIAIGFLR
jgi:hypothetical protein